jgi:PAS domain S-box-containing protein
MGLYARQEVETGISMIDAEEKFRGIAESSPDAIFTADLNGQFTYFSPAIKKFGYNPEDLLGKNFTDLLPESEITKAFHNFTRVEKGENTRLLEIKVLRKDGTQVFVEIDGSPILKEGRAVGIVGMLRDISERKKMEEELRESEERFRGIAEDSLDSIFTVDLQGQITYFSPSIEKVGGFKPEELVGKNMMALFPESDIHKVSTTLARAARGESVRELELRILRKDGTLAFVEVNGSPIVKDGRVVGAEGILRDISESKKMEEELKERAQFLDAATDSIILRDLEGNIIYANEATYRTRGYGREELFKMNIRDLDTPENAKLVEQRTKEVMEKGEATWESAHICKDKSVMPVEVHARTIEVEGRKLVLSSVRDITKRKQAEERARQLQEYLQMQVDRMPIGLITWDPEFRIRTWNPSATKIFGFSEEEALGKHPYEIIVPKGTQTHVDEIWDRLLKGDVTAHSVNENITKDGRTIVCSWTNTPLQRDDGTLMGVISMVQDITEQRKAEGRVRELVYRLDGVSPGNSYLCESHELCLKIFVDLTLHDIPSLCIIRENPQELIEHYDLKTENIILLSSRPIAGCKAVEGIQEVSLIISQFLKKSSESVVLLDGLEYLITHFGFNTVYKFLQEKRFDFLEAKAVLLIPFALETLNSQERALLLTELKILK